MMYICEVMKKNNEIQLPVICLDPLLAASVAVPAAQAKLERANALLAQFGAPSLPSLRS